MFFFLLLPKRAAVGFISLFAVLCCAVYAVLVAAARGSQILKIVFLFPPSQKVG